MLAVWRNWMRCCGGLTCMLSCGPPWWRSWPRNREEAQRQQRAETEATRVRFFTEQPEVS